MALVVTYKHISGQLVDPIQSQEGRISNIQADKFLSHRVEDNPAILRKQDRLKQSQHKVLRF